MCSICLDDKRVTDKQFERILKNAIERIRLHVPNVIVNILNNIDVARIFDLTKGQKYCSKANTQLQRIECPCEFEGLSFLLLFSV